MTSKYSSTSVETTLQNAITSSGATSMVVSSGTGSALMGGVTLGAGNVDVFTVAIDVDTINEEIVFITNQSSDTMTIVRGQAGTSPVTHTAGASVKHILSSYDLTNFQSTVSPVVNVGFGGSTSGITTVQANAIAGTNTLTLPATTSDTLVGRATTDTLTNKTINFNNNTITNLPAASLDLTFNAQTGTTYTLVAGDKNKLVTTSNASSVTVTIPPSVFTAGEQINVQSIGVGLTSFAQGAGVTITSTGATSAAPILRAQFSAATIICTSSNNFTVIGDLS
jgi:ATP-dependent protease HslVU (ClpYQ) peptidase subunit